MPSWVKALGLCCSLVLAGCTSLSALFFYPQSVWISTPEDVRLEYQDVYLNAIDGTELHAWWIPAQGEVADSEVMVLFLHGNAENISSHSRSVYWLATQGVSLFTLDYRGFGASTGRALLPDILQDVEAAAAWLRESYPEKKLVILGQSIGTALAIDFTAHAGEQYHIEGLILDAPFTGFPAVARHVLGQNLFGWVIWPFTVLVPKRWDPIKQLDKITVPVLIMHSRKDRVVPYQQGRKLYQRWQQLHPQQRLEWLESEGAHIMSFAFPRLRRQTLEFIYTLADDKKASLNSVQTRSQR